MSKTACKNFIFDILIHLTVCCLTGETIILWSRRLSGIFAFPRSAYIERFDYTGETIDISKFALLLTLKIYGVWGLLYTRWRENVTDMFSRFDKCRVQSQTDRDGRTLIATV